MTKKKNQTKNNTEVKTVKVEPTKATETKPEKVTEPAKEEGVVVPEGHALIVPIDQNGNQRGKPFFATERTTEKVYENNPSFEVKKKQY